MQSSVILVNEFSLADAASAGTRLSLPARVDGRFGRLVVHVECFQAAPQPSSRRRVRLLDAAELAKVRATMLVRLSETVRRDELAALIGMSVSDFSRAFHASAGATFADELLRLRLAAAKNLMRTTRQTLCDIALASGFGDQSNFSRRFVRAVGVTPSTWRALHRHAA